MSNFEALYHQQRIQVALFKDLAKNHEDDKRFFIDENERLKREISNLKDKNPVFAKQDKYITNLEMQIAGLEDEKLKSLKVAKELQDEVQKIQEKVTDLEGENISLRRKSLEKKYEC